MARGLVAAGIAAIVASVGLGAVADATTRDPLAIGVAGSACDDPLTWKLSPGQLQAAFDKTSGVRPGPGDGIRPRPGGPRIRLAEFSGANSQSVTVTTYNWHWRICAMRSPADRATVVAPVPKRRSRSQVYREYVGPRSSLTITYARRNPARDGASCANPYVVRAESSHIGGESSGASRNRFAGIVQIVHKVTAGRQAHEYARWHAKPGYRTCYASALVDDYPNDKPWIDFRPSGKHYLTTYTLPGYHGFSYDYVYATFARTDSRAKAVP